MQESPNGLVTVEALQEAIVNLGGTVTDDLLVLTQKTAQQLAEAGVECRSEEDKANSLKAKDITTPLQKSQCGILHTQNETGEEDSRLSIVFDNITTILAAVATVIGEENAAVRVTQERFAKAPEEKPSA